MNHLNHLRSSIIALLLGLLVILPTAAQTDQTITEIASSSDQFETLVDALQAAELAETLDNPDASLTVFAPTDDAFEAALGELGLTAEQLLGDAPTLTTILQYHVVEGAVFSEDLSAGDVSTLAGDTVTIGLSNGTVTVNDATVTTPDVEASNGVIHVIDRVLLPPSLTDTPTDDDAAVTPDDTPEPDTLARVRVAHFSPDAPAVDIYANGEVIIENLAYPEMSAFGEFPAGTYEIAVAPADTSVEDSVIGPADFVFANNTYSTIAAVGTLENETLAPAVLLEDPVIPIPDGQATLTVAHAIEGAPAVDVYANGELLADNLSFPGELGDSDGAIRLDVVAGTYDLTITPTGDPETTLLSAEGIEIASNMLYLIAAIGTPDAPDLQIIDVAFNDEMPDTTADDDADPERSVFEVVTENAGFNSLVDAIEAAELQSTLNDPDAEYTLFAPDDDAFENALGELGITADELLNDDATLQRILSYHVIEGTLSEEDLLTMDSVTTLNGDDIQIEFTEGGLILNGTVEIIASDLAASNGVVHTVDEVLLPQLDEE